MNLRLLILLLMLSPPPSLWAQAETETPTVPDAEVAAPAEEAEAAAGDVPRDPFWPVGYHPEANQETVAEAGPEVVEQEDPEPVLSAEDIAAIRQRLASTGLVKKGERMFAFVNGQLVTVGDQVTVEHNGINYNFSVTGFKDGQVLYEADWNASE